MNRKIQTCLNKPSQTKCHVCHVSGSSLPFFKPLKLSRLTNPATEIIVINEASLGNYKIEKKSSDANLKPQNLSAMTAFLSVLLTQQVLRYCWCALHLAATDKNLL